MGSRCHGHGVDYFIYQTVIYVMVGSQRGARRRADFCTAMTKLGGGSGGDDLKKGGRQQAEFWKLEKDGDDNAGGVACQAQIGTDQTRPDRQL